MSDKVTTCVTCGKTVSYTTKKPKWCKACKKKQPKYYRKSKKQIPSKSSLEKTTQYALNELLPDLGYVDNGYYSFLKSPKGAPLQLDRFYPKAKLAFEIQGRQHTVYTPYIHKTKEAFKYLQQCDAIKKKTCKKYGITLIEIPHDAKITKEYLMSLLKHANVVKTLQKHTRIQI